MNNLILIINILIACVTTIHIIIAISGRIFRYELRPAIFSIIIYLIFTQEY